MVLSLVNWATRELLQAVLERETVPWKEDGQAVHSRDVPPEIAGRGYFFGIHHHRVTLHRHLREVEPPYMAHSGTSFVTHKWLGTEIRVETLDASI